MSSSVQRQLLAALITIVATGLAYLSCSGSLFWVAPGWQIGLFCGAVAGLVGSGLMQAGIAGPLTVMALAAIDAPWYADLYGRSLNAQEAAILLMMTLVGAFGVAALRFSAGLPPKRVSSLVAISLLGMVLVNVWVTSLTVNTSSLAQNGTQLVVDLERDLQPMSYTSDADQYLRTLQLMRQGTPYYDAVVESWLGKKETESLPWGVVSYRLPSLFWIWNALPQGGMSIIVAFLVATSVAVVAAFAIPAQLGLIRLAPVAASLVAGNYLVTSVSLFLMYVDPWGMALALAGFAVFFAASLREEHRLAWLAAALCLAAALIREILIYIPLFILGSALLMPRGRRLRAAVPWVVCVAAFSLVYVAHILAIDGRVSPTALAEVWSRGSIASLMAAVNLGQELMSGAPWVLPFVLALGIAGAAALWRAVDRRLSAVALCCTTIPLLSLAFLGNPGLAPGEIMVNYWGMLFIPMSIALAPAAILLLRPASAKPAVAAESASARKVGAKTRSKKR